jgi:hypothetical protein
MENIAQSVPRGSQWIQKQQTLHQHQRPFPSPSQKQNEQQTLDAVQSGHATCMQIQIVVFGKDAGYMYPAMFPGLYIA